jgi:hypothetical protein
MQTHAARTIGRDARPALAAMAALQRPLARPAATGQPIVQRACAACEEETAVARFTDRDRSPAHVPPIVNEVNRTAGQPLPHAVRGQFEAAFGWSFANVRVHADDRAGQAARAVNALAYTSGNHVVFAAGQFSPGSKSGRGLLAHELAHVVQQTEGRASPGISRPGDASEREAERMAESVSGVMAEAGPAGPAPAALVASAPPVAQASGGASGPVVQRAVPGDGMVPPGDCAWSVYIPLRAAVEAAKLVVNALGACTAGDLCPLLASKIAAISAEIAARVALDSTCFKGGDTGHRQQVQDKVNMLNRCTQFFAQQNCAAQLAAAAAAAAAAAVAVVNNASKIGEALSAIGELITGAAEAGEAVEGGVTLIEVLEGIGLVLLL